MPPSIHYGSVPIRLVRNTGGKGRVQKAVKVTVEYDINIIAL